MSVYLKRAPHPSRVIPAVVILRVLNEWIADHPEIQPSESGALGHIAVLAHRIDHERPEAGMRMLYRVPERGVVAVVRGRRPDRVRHLWAATLAGRPGAARDPRAATVRRR